MRYSLLAIWALTSLSVVACKSPRDASPAGAPVANAGSADAPATTAPALPETERLLLLRMQVGYIDREAPYGDIGTPPGFESLVGPGGAIGEAARARWEAERAKPEVERDARGLFWLTEQLEQSYEQQDRIAQAQQIDEAALASLQDTGYRQILRCHLARLAANHGDLVGAHRWLLGNDERPGDINLDSELRMARVALAFAEHDWPVAVAQLGRTREDVPFASRWAVNAAVKRAHALEQQGELGAAAAELLYWMKGPRDRALVMRAPAASFAQQIDRMVTLHHYATDSYALARSRLKTSRLASR